MMARWMLCLGAAAVGLVAPITVCAQASAAPSVEGPRVAAPGPRRVQDSARAPLDRRVSLDLERVTLSTVLQEIVAQTGIKLVYSGRVVPLSRRVTVRVRNVSVREALADVLNGTDVEVQSKADLVVLERRNAPQSDAPMSAESVVGSVQVWVRDSLTEEPVPHVLVAVKGMEAVAGMRATTSRGGEAWLRGLEAGTHTIVTRILGYLPQEKAVTVLDDRSDVVEFLLRHTQTRLQEVVTTASGRQRRLELANAITVLQADSIMATQPIKDMTDLLENRVPGLVTLPTTGAPGDPSRLRLRGSSSIMRSNDPIVIVDGVRIYAEQSADRSASLTGGGQIVAGGEFQLPTPAPSALDRIDPNSVETVEVLNGPSAATLYGADAANGVIVITTKRGKPGPARWDLSVARGMSYMPGRFPDAYVTFGRALNSDVCSVVSHIRAGTCSVDSVVAYQVLNDPELTVLGQGHSSSVSGTVSGGAEGGSNLAYAVTGSYSHEVGLLELPQYEADRFRTAFGRAPEDWMERPHDLTKWSLASRFDFKPAPAADVALTLSVSEDEQGRSNLEHQLSALRGAYVDKTTGLIYLNGISDPQGPSPSLVPDFYQKTINRALALRTGLNVTWRPLARFTVRGNAGISADVRRDESLLPRGLRRSSDNDSLGFLATGQATTRLGTLDFGASYNLPLVWGFRLDAASGFTYTSTFVSDLFRREEDPQGGSSSLGESSAQNSNYASSYGWYVEPRIGNQRIFFSSGLRFDGGSNYGSRVGFGGFRLPKLGFSWLISDEPFFPLRNSRLLSLLRIRAAYGKAGVQPGPTDRLRTYGRETGRLDGRVVGLAPLGSVGNRHLRPERSTEVEGGLDADLFDSRLSVGVTAYRKTKDDALLRVGLPPSVGGSVVINIGVVRNTGLELTLGADVLRTNFATWTTQLHFSQNRNVVVSLAEGVDRFALGGPSCAEQCVVAGYPLFGYWERPVAGYADENGDGVLQLSEILLADSSAFLGAPEPDFTAALHTTLGLFRGALTLSASVDYRDGFAQRNNAPGGVLARALMDPSAPLSDQALALSDHGLVQSLSTLRLNSLSIGWHLPPSALRWAGARSGWIRVEGTNLGLATNYRGKDPLVNSAGGGAVFDFGALPRPREWRVALNFSY